MIPRSTVDVSTNGICCTGSGVVPYRRRITACKYSRMPTDATTLASGGAVRNGRNTKKCSVSPSTTQKSNDNSSAGQNCMFGPNDTNVGMSGRSNVSSAWNQWTTPSIGASGFGSGGTSRSPWERSVAYT